MRYVLDRRYQLRGWKGAPTGVFDTLSKTVLFLDKDDYRLLIQCDGAHDMTEGNTTPEQHDLLETLEAQGYIHKAGLLRYPELIMKLAERQGGSVATRDVENLLHLHRKQAYRLLVKLVEDGSLVLVGRGGGAHYEITEEGWERIGH